MKKEIVNLHGHSFFSLLDGMTRPNELVDRTLELGQPASCITDHGVMYSIVDHFQYAESKGQKAIAGFEAYVVKDHTIKDKTEAKSESENKREHLVLLAKNNEGYKKITKMCSVGTTDGFYYRPRIDDKVIQEVGTKDVIAMSACIGGRIAQRIVKDDIEGAEKWAIYYYKMFNGEFYLEIQPTKDPEQVKVNMGLIEIHKKTGIPIVATTDFHYLRKEDALTHEVLLAMQSRSLMSDPNRWKFPGDTFYVMNRDEMTAAFNSNGHEILDKNIIELAMDTTLEITDKCNVSFEWGKHYLPKINAPDDDVVYNNKVKRAQQKNPEFKPDSATFLRHICQEGLKKRHKTNNDYLERLRFELSVIENMGFPDYFLIMWDIMKYCRDNDIPTGPARGCWVEDMIVNTQNRGPIKIKDVQVGDLVIGHEEIIREVIKTLEYDCNEEIVSLNVNKKSLDCTKDHEIFAIKKEDWDIGIREPQWYKADELTEGDYIAELED